MKTDDPDQAERAATSRELNRLAERVAEASVDLAYCRIKISRLRAALARETAARVELGRAFDESTRTLEANRAFSTDLQKQAANVRAEFKPLADLLQKQKEELDRLRASAEPVGPRPVSLFVGPTEREVEDDAPPDLSKLEPVTVGIPADLLKQIPPELIVGDPGEAQRAKDNRS